MKKIIMALATLGIISAGSQALAEMNAPLACNLSFHAKGGGLKLIVGTYSLTGPGVINCYDTATGHSTDAVPVTVTLGSSDPEFTIAGGIEMEVWESANGVSVRNGVDSLMGRFVALGGHSAVGFGIGATTTFKNDLATIPLTVSGVKGLGLSLGITYMDIQPRQ